jgi:hypothetical protein
VRRGLCRSIPQRLEAGALVGNCAEYGEHISCRPGEAIETGYPSGRRYAEASGQLGKLLAVRLVRRAASERAMPAAVSA